MVIAVNARTLKRSPGDGIGWFTHEVIRRIIADHPEHRFVLISDRRYDTLPLAGDNIEYLIIPLRNVHPAIWYLWHELLLPGVLKKVKADLYIAPDGLMPLRTSVPCIPVIHDLNHEHRPKDIPWSERMYYRHYFPLFAAKAVRVATVSDFSAGDISRIYGIDRKKIDVVPNGVADIFSPPLPGEAEETRKEYCGGRPYFLFVSNFSPRKNVETVIKAYDIFRRESRNEHRLLLAGRRLYLTGAIDRAIEDSPYSQDIIFTGSVGRDVLRRLYGAAEALVFVPWLEGFGIPVVEAQRCGTPCILSDTSSLPEVSGGAALCAGPAGAEAIAGAMARLATDEALRRHLSEQGILNSQRYSWDNAAKKMWDCITSALNPIHDA
ncbi:MAG: glycosyltransferase family 4 protein [Bacteroidales bacterium]|jgi:glycosyltransferase involved in cell wall biosynthesis|nr:glycosyltransferase family 4 protein [Bacteroidales bacterium]